MRLRKLTAIGALALTIAGATAAPALAGGKPGGSATTCNPRKTQCTTTTTAPPPPTDTVAPSVAITAPTGGSTISGVVTMAGPASDNSSVAKVEVKIDAGAWTAATGTTSWSRSIDTSQLAAGGHTLTARATDASGNTSTASVSVNVASSSGGGDTPPPSTGTVIDDPKATGQLYPLARTRLATWGSVTGVPYMESGSNRRAVMFRDATTRQSSFLDLPVDSLAGWSDVGVQMTSPSDLWIFGGTGPLVARHYVLSGGPLPTSATLVETRSFGDADSRSGDLLALAGGGLVAAWHQQGSNGLPQGQLVAYRSPAGVWSQLPPLTFMPTKSSDQVMAQHPGDGAVWLFNNPDGWGAVGAARLRESGGSLAMEWSDGFFIYSSRVGTYGCDPENADLAVTASPATNELVLAYQSADRTVFSTSPWVVGSRVAIAKVRSDGATAFSLSPERAERVSDIGVVVSGTTTTITYRAVDESTLTWDEIHVARYSGTWSTPVSLGDGTGDVVAYASGRGEISTRMADGELHLFDV